MEFSELYGGPTEDEIAGDGKKKRKKKKSFQHTEPVVT